MSTWGHSLKTTPRVKDEHKLRLTYFDNYYDYCRKWEQIVTYEHSNFNDIYPGLSFIRTVRHIMQENIKEEYYINDNFINILHDSYTTEFYEWDDMNGNFCTPSIYMMYANSRYQQHGNPKES